MTRAELLSRMQSLKPGDLAVLRQCMARSGESRGRATGAVGRLIKLGMVLRVPTGYYTYQVDVSNVGRAALYSAPQLSEGQS